MKFEQIIEGVGHNDLKGLVSNRISIAEFEPKTGNEEDVIVVAFYVKDDKPAQDLATFMEKGVVDILDTEVSPNADDDGHYLVFVEMKNENIMKTTLELLDDVARICSCDDWSLEFYGGKTVSIKADEIEGYLKKN
ncbi:MAG: hypothetical protein CMD92_08370 [Gammaproteobacteria bacterium]|nr:hypothetical protein [Gammaproteobacteria bacterium]|tara:strand:+ start:1004 stop:1411 length:408 start_codon:yes stop_codon:yes gene_type:complete